MMIPIRSFLFLTLLISAFSHATAGDAWQRGWPSLLGPQGNLSALPPDTPLIEDLALARLAWRSETSDFGTAKTGSTTWNSAAGVSARLGPERKTHPGSWAGVIVANGMVYGSSFRPAGDFVDVTFTRGENSAQVSIQTDAEDILIAIDADTGATRWIAAEPRGMIHSGGKRGGFQVAPAYADGTVFWLGSTGRVFAHNAESGERLWQNTIPAHAAMAAQREAKLKAASEGRFSVPGGPSWFTSLVVAEKVVVVPTFVFRGNDTGLTGMDPATGETLWTVPASISRYATPNVWRHQDRDYLIAATNSGHLQMIDPRDGTVLWKVEGLGINAPTLSPSENHILVNIVPNVPRQRTPGRWGCYRISPEGAERVWELPEDPANDLPTWKDTVARVRYLARGNTFFAPTWGAKGSPGRILLLNAEDGRVLAEGKQSADISSPQSVGDYHQWIGDNWIVRSDFGHGATHGGRKPLLAWHRAGDTIQPLGEPDKPSGLDLAEFLSAYEVNIELPVVDGRIFERTEDGRLVCYDLRRQPGETLLRLELPNGWLGLPGPLPVEIRVNADGAAITGKVWPPDSVEAGLIYMKARRFAQWESVRVGAFHLGTLGPQDLSLTLGTHTAEMTLELEREGQRVSGVWTRHIPALGAEVVATAGALTGTVHNERGYPTGWLPAQPFTPLGKNPPGVRTFIVGAEGAITLQDNPPGLNLFFDVDAEGKVIRAAAAALSYSQSWHEVDPGTLRLEGDRLRGDITVVLNGDGWKDPNPEKKASVAGKLSLDARVAGDNSLSGTYRGAWGMAVELKGTLRGTISNLP